MYVNTTRSENFGVYFIRIIKRFYIVKWLYLNVIAVGVVKWLGMLFIEDRHYIL